VRNRIVSLTGAMAMAIVMAIAVACLTTVPARGQASKAPPKAYTGPRLPDGHPDLQGTYDVATLTPVERGIGAKAVYTPEEAAKLEKAVAATKEKNNEAIQGDRAAPPKGGDGSVGAAGNVGGYNTFWLDPGSKYTVVDGQIRASIVVDPPDGRVPPVTAAARQRMAALRARPTSDALESRDPGLEPPGSYDDPERRPLGERCLLGFASTSGPPALPDYFYNNLHQIVQTKDSVMILTEMVHDARIIRMNAQHLPKTIRRWMGDSVGRWEGDTLVVDTTNFNDKTRFRGSTENLHVVERFSRAGPRALLYRFTIEDPETWDRPWTGEYGWPLTDEPIFEYACHEANYAMGDILRGARLRENEEAAKSKK
jgi:hypothetical protein